MSNQSFKDESNWKHEPHTEHHVEDKFGKGTDTRNWNKNLDQRDESKENKGQDKDRRPENESKK